MCAAQGSEESVLALRGLNVALTEPVNFPPIPHIPAGFTVNSCSQSQWDKHQPSPTSYWKSLLTLNSDHLSASEESTCLSADTQVDTSSRFLWQFQ